MPIGINTCTHVRDTLNTLPCMFSGTCIVNQTNVGVFNKAIMMPVIKLKMMIKIEKTNFEFTLENKNIPINKNSTLKIDVIFQDIYNGCLNSERFEST